MAEISLQKMLELYGKMAQTRAAKSDRAEKRMRSLVATHLKQVALVEDEDGECEPPTHVRCPDGTCMPAEIGCVSLKSQREPEQ